MKYFFLLFLAFICGCKSTPKCDPTVDVCDTPIVIPDGCNSRAEALSDPQCALTLGAVRNDYISFAGDQDWYMVQLPATLTGRSLLHISAAYAVPNTAVNLTLNLLDEAGTLSLARKIDHHGQAAPQPIDIILPFSQSGAKLIIQLSDEKTTNSNFDVRSQYSLKVEVLDNPDVNEPNDTDPTHLLLPNVAGGVAQGQKIGVLATDNDVDKFDIVVAPTGHRRLLYLHLTAPRLTPAANNRLSYILYNSAHVPISEDAVANEYLAVDLATARLVVPGTYTVVVQGYQSGNIGTVAAGDLREQYTLEARVMDDSDVLEPNDYLSEASPVSLPLGQSAVVNGRIAYIADSDWFAIDLGTSPSNPGTLSYKWTVDSSGGRYDPIFNPLSPLPTRQLRILTQLVSATSDSCQTDPTVCPKNSDNQAGEALANALCLTTLHPLCLWSERDEYSEQKDLHNFEGSIPVPSHSGNLRYYLVVQDEGSHYADDRLWTLTLSYQSDADEGTRAALTNQTVVNNITESANFPVPPTTSEVSGIISHGHGRYVQFDINKGDGIRGPRDYDAVIDYDRYEFDVPALTAPTDRTWTLEWEIDHLSDGGTPADLALDVEFCDGTKPSGSSGCSSVFRTLAYTPDPIQSWYGANPGIVAWSKASATSTIITAQPPGCFCLEPRFSQAGKFFINVGAIDRVSNQPVSYKLRTGLASYPQNYTDGKGMAATCPVATVVGMPSCNFAGN